MKRYELLREYLRACEKARNQPTAEAFKKVEYLLFLGANICPACGEEIAPNAYTCEQKEDGFLENHIQDLLLEGDYIYFGTQRGATRFYWNSPYRIDQP